VELKSQIQPNDNQMLPNFMVLLSLYNPSLDFLKIQLDSINKQIDVDLEIIVRIDGFDFMLQDWLEGYLKETELKFTILTGERIGACASFFELLKHVQNYEYIAFADQDDYWASSKLKSTVLPDKNILPTLIIAGMKDFKHNDEISLILESKEERHKTPKAHLFSNALIENVFQGARMTLNRSATDLIKSNLPNADKVVMHDAWIYLVLSAFGSVRQVNEITFLYRQHENNLIGLKSKSFLNRTRRIFWKNNDKRMSMAEEFAIRYPDSEYARSAGMYSSILSLPRFQRLKVLSNLKLNRSKKSVVNMVK
jgi:hypothetical protein